jgi:decaprenylphospho-beta-D-erythro-pentofuranosid-2-ulose 2-reductase
MLEKIVIVGATSAIAYEAAKHFAAQGAELFLVARTAEKLETVAADLKVRGARRSETFLLDVTDYARQREMFDAALAALGRIDGLLIAHGTLSDQRKCELSVEETLKEFQTNALSVIALLTLAANYFEQRGSGCLAVLSSVAGDRGRPSNYVYGAAKGAVSIFLQGLRARLAKRGVAVVTIKPGMVDTPMTAHLKKGLLFSAASKVGLGVYKAMQRRRSVVYLPGYWRLIMWIIRAIPEGIFQRLSL